MQGSFFQTIRPDTVNHASVRSDSIENFDTRVMKIFSNVRLVKLTVSRASASELTIEQFSVHLTREANDKSLLLDATIRSDSRENFDAIVLKNFSNVRLVKLTVSKASASELTIEQFSVHLTRETNDKSLLLDATIRLDSIENFDTTVIKTFSNVRSVKLTVSKASASELTIEQFSVHLTREAKGKSLLLGATIRSDSIENFDTRVMKIFSNVRSVKLTVCKVSASELTIEQFSVHLTREVKGKSLLLGATIRSDSIENFDTRVMKIFSNVRSVKLTVSNASASELTIQQFSVHLTRGANGKSLLLDATIRSDSIENFDTRVMKIFSNVRSVKLTVSKASASELTIEQFSVHLTREANGKSLLLDATIRSDSIENFDTRVMKIFSNVRSVKLTVSKASASELTIEQFSVHLTREAKGKSLLLGATIRSDSIENFDTRVMKIFSNVRSVKLTVSNASASELTIQQFSVHLTRGANGKSLLLDATIRSDSIENFDTRVIKVFSNVRPINQRGKVAHVRKVKRASPCSSLNQQSWNIQRTSRGTPNWAKMEAGMSHTR